MVDWAMYAHERDRIAERAFGERSTAVSVESTTGIIGGPHRTKRVTWDDKPTLVDNISKVAVKPFIIDFES